MRSKHGVVFIGNGVYKDNEGKLWSKTDIGTEVLSARSYETDGTQEQFLKVRSDLGFMITYGSMKINTVSLDEEADVEPNTTGTNTNTQIGTQTPTGAQVVTQIGTQVTPGQVTTVIVE